MAETKTTEKKKFDIDPATLKLIAEAEKGISSFAFDRPDVDIPVGKKLHVKLGANASSRASVQILNKGGENNLHYHANMDLMYMVLKGKVRFYGEGDRLLGEYAPFQGVTLPQYSRYWFESAGDDEAWLLQIAGYPSGAEQSKRIPVEEGNRPSSDLWIGLSEEEETIRRRNNR